MGNQLNKENYSEFFEILISFFKVSQSELGNLRIEAGPVRPREALCSLFRGFHIATREAERLRGKRRRQRDRSKSSKAREMKGMAADLRTQYLFLKSCDLGGIIS